jgi:hypothetical protein
MKMSSWRSIITIITTTITAPTGDMVMRGTALASSWYPDIVAIIAITTTITITIITAFTAATIEGRALAVNAKQDPSGVLFFVRPKPVFKLIELILGPNDLILRSLRSKRLEGWTQAMDSRPSFETRAMARSSG